MGVFSELELWYFLASSTGIDQAKSKSSGEWTNTENTSYSPEKALVDLAEKKKH
jgi:hypothetical protein